MEIIEREMTAFARRARAAAAWMHPELSLVSFTLLSRLEDRDGSRVVDLAAHYRLDKSTVSRQVAALERDGLIERRPDPGDHRAQVLHLTAAGRRALAGASARRHELFAERLADWPAEDLARFADYVVAFNARARD
ncbi:MarR family transcriptional regulator [Actinocorallia herbida]|uniref:MarR family transcriptional regulator n=1 Tax=Actinocorallia herbida TaxID=58109 RepID=A0A3N1D4H3_9ACTN|nr:MarR family transcriptional regulator [Actinocorallia herbida]